jgi:GNAT superfamily N-acetyltransferase
MSYLVKLAQSDEQILSCFDVMQQLRPKLVRASFVTIVRELMGGGYELAYVESDKQVVAAAGFRVAQNLFFGKHLYVDDLVTDEHVRSGGFGRILMDWLTDYAKQNGCEHIHLDSGVQRHKAHRFYLNQGMDIVCYHFDKAIV